MYRRDSSNSPTLSYVVTVLPFIIIMFLYFALYTTYFNGVVMNFYTCVVVVLLAVWMTCSVVYMADVLVPKFLLFLLYGGLAVCVILFFVYVYQYLVSFSTSVKQYLYKALLVVALVAALVAVFAIYGFVSPREWSTRGPAFLREFLVYLDEQWRETPWIFIFILFACIGTILAYFLVPLFLEQNPWSFSKPNFNGVRWLQKGRFMLNTGKEKVVASSSDLKVTNTEFEANPYLKNYSISLWVFINPKESQQSGETLQRMGPTNIFCYGTRQKRPDAQWEMTNPKPQLSYMYDEPTKKNTFMVRTTGQAPYSLYLDNQAWHHFVFVYTDNHLELFVDGVLDKSFGVPTEMPLFTEDDVIVLGDTANKTPLYGAVSDVIYYDYPMTPTDVVTAYSIQPITVTRFMNS